MGGGGGRGKEIEITKIPNAKSLWRLLEDKTRGREGGRRRDRRRSVEGEEGASGDGQEERMRSRRRRRSSWEETELIRSQGIHTNNGSKQKVL